MWVRGGLVLLFCVLSACSTFQSSQAQHWQLAEIHAELALMDLQHDEPLAAKEALLAALRLAPEDPRVLVSWGYYLARTGDDISAAQAYQQALTLAPDNPEVQDDYAVFLYQRKDYQQALTYFLQAAENEHYLYTGLAYQNASLAASQLGEVSVARDYQEKADKMLAGSSL